MRKPSFEITEEEFDNFVHECLCAENKDSYRRQKFNLKTMAKRRGYIRRNPVEEAEEMYDKFMLSYNTDGLIFNYDSIKIFNKYREAIQYLKAKLEVLK